MYREDINIERGIQSEWSKVVDEVKIYELKLPKVLSKLPTGITKKWLEHSPGIPYGRSLESAEILEVVEVWINPKNTVKVAVLGKGKDFILFTRNYMASGFLNLSFERYGNDSPDIFDNLVKGAWLIAKPKYRGNTEKIVAFVTQEKNLKDVEAILETLRYLWRTKTENNSYKWRGEAKIKSYGTVSLSEVLKQKVIFDRALRRFKWNARKERWDLWNSVKANITFKKTDTKLKVKLKALDGRTYFLDCPVTTEKQTGWPDLSLFELKYWQPFIYRKKDDGFLKLSPQGMTSTLVKGYLLPILAKIPKASFVFGMDNRTVKVERKRTRNKATLNFLNGELVKADSIDEKLEKFFILGIPIVTNLTHNIASGKRRVMSKQALKLIDEGLNGYLVDLEGKLPFHLNVIYKKKERKWYIEIAGKEFHVKGGYGALSKVSSAINGTAVVDREKYGWGKASKGTEIIKDRIGELVGQKKALWIILHVKRMGALMKAIHSED